MLKMTAYLFLVQFTDNSVSWMGYNSTKHTGNITSSECNNQLFTLSAVSPTNLHNKTFHKWHCIIQYLGLGTTYLYSNSTVRSKQANFIMVYGICLIHSGTRDLQKPLAPVDKSAIIIPTRDQFCQEVPSSLRILGQASLSVLANPGVVWILTLAASIGDRAMSAKNSADAEAPRYNQVLYKNAFSSPIKSVYHT